MTAMARLIFILLIPTFSFSQKMIFDNPDVRADLIVIQSHDSIIFTINIKNKSANSFYYSKDYSNWHDWSVSKNQLTIEVGTDQKYFNENSSLLIQIRSNEIMTQRIAVPSLNTSFTLHFAISLYCSEATEEKAIMVPHVKRPTGKWVWCSYYIPLELE